MAEIIGEPIRLLKRLFYAEFFLHLILAQVNVKWVAIVSGILQSFVLKWANPGLFFIYFHFFKNTLQVLQQINVKICPSSILCQDSNSQPLERESPPMTTRPGLPPLFNKVWKVLNTEWQIKGNFLQLWVRSCSDPKASIYFAKKYFPRIFFFFFSRSLRRFYFNYFFVIIEFFGNNFRAIESEYEIVLCFKNMGQPRPLFRHVSFFLSTFYRQNYRLQQDSNSDRRSRRRPRWPLDHHHVPCVIVLFALKENGKNLGGTDQVSIILCFGKMKLKLKYVSLSHTFCSKSE